MAAADHRPKVVVVGSETVWIRTGAKKTVRVTPDRTAKKLLAKQLHLKVTLTVKQSGHTVRSRTINFKTKPAKKKRR